MSVDMTPADNLNDQVAYVLLNKVKHLDEKFEDVSFTTEDFQGIDVSREEVIEQLQHLLQSNYIMGEIEQNGDANALVTCKNASITTDGRGMLKAKYFKVDQT